MPNEYHFGETRFCMLVRIGLVFASLQSLNPHPPKNLDTAFPMAGF